MEETNESFMKKHKTKIVATATFIIGAAGTYILTQNSDILINSFKQNNIAILGGKNVITTDLARRGHPGFIVRDIESGIVAASKKHLASILDVSSTTLQKMVDSGAVEILGEAK